MIVEKVILIQDIEPVFLFGSHETHLQKIESLFPDCFFTLRGNMFRVKGNRNDVQLIEKIISEMRSFVNEKGELSSEDVEYISGAVIHEPNKTINLNSNIVLLSKKGVIRSKTLRQKEMVEASMKNDILFAIGPAGTGKTYMSVAIAISALKCKTVEKIVLARPAIEAGENLGFLPGELSQKIDPYLTPLYDALTDMLSAEKLKDYIEKKIIEIVPLAYMRGRTFNNSFMILDEAQNATSLQMKMFLTRLGLRSKSIIMGDISQVDLPKSQKSGLIEAIELFPHIKGIHFTFLQKVDIIRHRLVKEIVEAYDNKIMSDHAKPPRS